MMDEQLNDCGCCEGVEPLTPQPIANRPGLEALNYRVGTHATFLKTMQARLAHLRGLTTRATDDPAIALLDSWALVAEVLTFYQERIANEGYLRTATERRSVVELARLVGYRPRPGLAASVFLAYTLDDHQTDPVTIPAGAKAQSVPGPGEQMQTFETSEPLEARAAWNALQPRLTQPQTQASLEARQSVYLKGLTLNLKPGDPLLIDIGSGTPNLYRVMDVTAEPVADRTRVTYQPWIADNKMISPKTFTGTHAIKGDPLAGLLPGLLKAPSRPPPTPHHLARSLAQAFTLEAEAGLQTLSALRPELNFTVKTALANAQVIAPNSIRVYALRVKAAPFGHNAPLKPMLNAQGRVVGTEEWPLAGIETFTVRVETAAPSPEPFNLALASSAGEGLTFTVTISLTRGAETLTASAEISSAQPEQRVQLGQLAEVMVQGKFQDVSLTALAITAKDIGHQVTLEIQNNGNQCAIELVASGFSPHVETVALGNTRRVMLENRRIAIAFARSGLTITDEVPRPPSPKNLVDLETTYDQILPGSWVVLQRADAPQPHIETIRSAQAVSRADYGISGKVTRLTLEHDWLTNSDRLLRVLRGTQVFAQSEELPLAEEPLTDPVCMPDAANDWIELDGLYSDLKAGRWLMVSGERADLENTSGVRASELVMLAEVEHRANADLPGDKIHTFIRLSEPLAYCYQRAGLTINANVVKATHGETRAEVLGGGQAAQAWQTLALRQPPLTFVAAPTPAGAESTLQVFVNEVRWREVESLSMLGPTEHGYLTRTDDAGQTRIIFGDGQRGARPPTGVENISAIYRNQLGQTGNVRAEQISLLGTRPLGVKSVINPLRASGGADKESRDQARRNAPLTVMALDRLVSVCDYADFARVFAGIGQAVARRFSAGRRELIHLTIAGVNDIPIEEHSDLYLNLVRALRRAGDPHQPFQVQVRELRLIVISANIRIWPDYLWENIVVNVRQHLLETFSFERRALGRDVALSEVIHAIQSVKGVAYVDVDVLGGIPEKKADGATRRLLTPQEIAQAVQALLAERAAEHNLPDQDKQHPRHRLTVNLAGVEGAEVRPAQLALLSPHAPDTLILNRI